MEGYGLVLFMFLPLTILVKEAYEIYYTGKKAHLKEKPLVRYGLPLLCAMLIMPYIVKIFQQVGP